MEKEKYRNKNIVRLSGVFEVCPYFWRHRLGLLFASNGLYMEHSRVACQLVPVLADVLEGGKTNSHEDLRDLLPNCHI